MRATFTCVGVGKRYSGVSKKGNTYDFQPISFVYEDKDFSGFKALTVNVNGFILDDVSMIVNNKYDVVFHFANGNCYLDAVLGSVSK